MTRVLIVHNAYQQKGGEDTAVETERRLLEAHGTETSLHLVSNETIAGWAARARTMLSVRDNRRQVARVLEHARHWRPDVVHVHNFFPLLSPGLHVALARIGLPVVQTLHNYRLLCANGIFLRDGSVCVDCLVGSSLNAVRHACYRGSHFGSAAVVAMQAASIGNRRWRDSISHFIALTAFQRDQLVAGGLPAAKIAVKGNSVADPGPAQGPRQGALFVGRLSREKGLDTLVAAFAQTPEIPLTVIGDGPDRERLERAATVNVRFEGALSHDDVISRMKAAAFLILPSIWYEGFPMTLVEAYACGLPVVASRIGGIPEIVDDGRTGYLFEPGNAAALASTLRRAFLTSADSGAMGQRARAKYEATYSPGANYEMLAGIYHSAMAQVGVPR
jgi:glycosyltransferase involved in cell wall biosynthesis